MAGFITPFDPQTSQVFTVPANMPNGGWIFLHNESAVELAIQLGNMATPVLVPAYVARCFAVRQGINFFKWASEGALTPDSDLLISLVFGELYDPDEWTGGEMYVSLARLTNVGNILTTASEIVNNGQPAGTNIIEAQPNDQGGTSWAENNDGSGNRRVISANILRSVWNVIRGNFISQKAVITIGDAGDPSITTLQGSVQGGQPANVGALTTGAITGTGANSFDGGNFTDDGAGHVTSIQQTAKGPSTYFEASIAGTANDQNGVIDIVDNTTGAIRWQLGKRSHVNGDSFRIIDATNGKQVMLIEPNAVGMLIAGAILNLAGVATSGSYGVTTVIGDPKDVVVSVATPVTILSITTPNIGSTQRIRVSLNFVVQGTNNGIITADCTYFDGANGGAVATNFDTYHGTTLNGATITKGAIFNITKPLEIETTSNSTLTVVYQNTAAGTINDLVTVTAEVIA